MAEFKIRDKETGEIFTIREKEPQTTKPQGSERMSGRKSAIADLIQNPPEMNKGGYAHPLGTLLRQLQGAGEYMQGVPASIALDLQAGQPQNIIPNLGKVLAGQRPAEYGDVFAGSGAPEPLAAGMGLATDIAFTPGGAQGVAGAGKAIKGVATKGMGALRDLMQSSRVLDKAQRAKQAIDATRDILGQAKEIALQEVKDLPAEVNWGKNVSQKVINGIKNPIYNVEFTPEGSVINTVGNLDKVKTALQDMLTSQDFVEASHLEKRLIKQFSGEVRGAMLKATAKAGKPELAKSLADYHDFMDKYNLINPKLVDRFGNAMANKLKATFKLQAEPAVKVAWKEVGKLNPEIRSIAKEMKAREVLKNLLKVSGIAAGTTLAGKGALSFLKRD